MPSPSWLPRPLLALLAVGAVALPLAACGSSDPAAGSGDVDPASAVPAASPFYAEVTVRPDGGLKSDVEAVARKLLRTSDPGGDLIRAIDKELADEDRSYAKDVEPWLGKRVGIAITGLRGEEPDVVAAAAVTDQDKAQDLIDSEAKGTEVREHAGTKYRYDTDEKTAVALVGDTLLFGTERGLQAAIDATKGAKLSDQQAFKDARDAVKENGIGFVYADPARLFDLVSSAASGTGSVSQAQLGQFKGLLLGSGVKGVAAALDVTDDALRIDAASVGTSGGKKGSGDAAGALAKAPANAWLAVGIGDVGGTVQRSLTGLAQAGGLGGVDPQTLIEQVNQQLGIDVQRDLLSWMGDASLFVTGKNQSELAGALVVQSKDPARSGEAVRTFERLLKLSGQVQIRSTTASGLESGFEVEVPGDGTTTSVTVGSKGDRFVIAYGAGALASALGEDDRLEGSQAYKDAVGALGGKAKPVFFLDLPQVVSLIQATAGDEPTFKQAKPTLDAFGPLAAGSTSDGDVQRVAIGVALR